MKCINCSKEIKNQANIGFFGFMLCKACDNTGRQLAKMFEQGVELEYSNGTKETVRFKK